MNEKLKEAFGQVRAEEQLKENTKEYIVQKTKGYKRGNHVNYKYVVSAFACAVFFILGGYRFYFTPTVQISIDINPSVELGVNRFDRVISFEGYNEDGRQLVTSVDVKGMDYSEAVNQIVESETVELLLAKEEIMTVSVVGTDDTQSEKIFAEVQSCTNGKRNTYCYYADSKEVQKAHEKGLSYGKYKAFLELQKLDSDITEEKIQNMTMREIHDLIEKLSKDDQKETNSFRDGKGGNRNGKEKKNRR